MTDRPYRHLCPEADKRDAMTDDEFWDHIARNLSRPVDDIGHPDNDDEPDPLDAVTCGECGETGACAWDSEGRPLIHTESKDADA